MIKSHPGHPVHVVPPPQVRARREVVGSPPIGGRALPGAGPDVIVRPARGGRLPGAAVPVGPVRCAAEATLGLRPVQPLGQPRHLDTQQGDLSDQVGLARRSGRRNIWHFVSVGLALRLIVEPKEAGQGPR